MAYMKIIRVERVIIFIFWVGKLYLVILHFIVSNNVIDDNDEGLIFT